MSATAPPPTEARRTALNLVVLHLERLEAELEDLRRTVQRMRRSLDGEVTGVLPVVPGPAAGPALSLRSPLLDRRSALRLSQAAVAREAGLSRSQVQSLEAGTRTGGGSLAALAAALDRLEAARR